MNIITGKCDHVHCKRPAGMILRSVSSRFCWSCFDFIKKMFGKDNRGYVTNSGCACDGK